MVLLSQWNKQSHIPFRDLFVVQNLPQRCDWRTAPTLLIRLDINQLASRLILILLTYYIEPTNEQRQSLTNNSMSEADIETITAKIAQLGEAVKQAKTDKKPKEEWEPVLKEMLAMKVS